MSDQENVRPTPPPAGTPGSPQGTPPPAGPPASSTPPAPPAGTPPASSPPPAGTPPAPPYGGEPPGGAPPPPSGTAFPWEQRATLGFGTAVVETIRQMISQPRVAFDSATRTGDYISPLLWIILIGLFSGLLQWMWSMFFLAPLAAMMPEEMAPMMVAVTGGGFVNLIYMPLATIVGIFIASVILHACLLIVGGLTNSKSGFEGTFRVSSYAATSQVAQIIPIVGSLIALVWNIVLLVIGFSSLHETTSGKAIAAVLVPILLCCVCTAVGFAMLGFLGAVAGTG